ncbi:MAG: AAA family ATPase, partial [Leptospiraceae bacterium]|nr:AAA family ATPase [Leptospiraceae bacterium]
RPWFIDFGIASRLQSRSETALQVGKLEGTLLYMSPEQTGRTNRKVDHRSDLYALGATFYQLLKGEPPYTSTDPLELIHSHLAKEPPPLEKDRHGSFVPAVLQDILRRLMERDPDERYSTAMGLALDLRKCLSRLEGRNQIPPFTLGEKDFPRGLMIPQYLYGREKDLEQIREILDSGRASLVLVRGESGSGKSSLIQEIRRNVAERQGMFLPGKFEAHKKDIPYHAILQGISIIVDSLLAEDDASVREWKEFLLERLRGNGQALVQLVPSLERLIGPQPDLVELAAEEEQVRFRLTLLAFLSAFQDHPLIFVLDDLQWADLASLDLIQDMLRNSENIYILGTYRSNEVNDLHPLKRAIDSYLLNGIELATIDLQPLGPRDLLRMLLETFRIAPSSEEANPVKDLAEALFKRSEGNPFVARQYLESLHEHGWIQLDREEGKWHFDLARIRMDGLTASSAELMARSLESVAQARDLLQAAACIGSRFSLSMAAGLVEQDVMLTLSQLQEVAQRDFIYPIGEQYKYVDRDSTKKQVEQVYYAFSHDRIYESVLQSTRPSVSEELNLKAARLILNVSNFHEIDEQVGTIVSYYNKGRNLVESDEEKLTIAKLNLRAGQRERKASAFDESVVHFGISLDTLFQRREAVPADLRMEIIRNLGEAEYLRGRKIVAQEHFDRVLKDSRSLHDKLKVFEFKIAIMGSGGQFAEAVGLGMQALKKAGIKLKNPRSPESMDLKSLIRQAQKMVPLHRKRRKQEPDPTSLSLARILSQTITPAFLINSNQLPELLTALMDLSEEKGPFPDTSVALVVLAVLVCQYRDAAEGRKMGEIAQDLVERFNARDVRGRVHYYFLSSVSPWTSDIQNRLPLLQRAADYSLEAGDLPFAALSLFDMLGQNLMFGSASLEESEDLLARYGPQIHGMGQESLSQMFNLMRQSFHLLKSGSRQRSQIAGDYFDESKVRPRWEDTGASRNLFYLQLFKNWLGLIYFTDQPAPVRLAGAGAPIAHFDSVFAEYLDCCLSLMQDKKGSAEKPAASLLDRLVAYEKQAPANFGFMRAHLQGELRWRQGDLSAAMDAFDEACAISASSAILCGMIQQRTAAFYLNLRKPRFARIYADRARQIFQQIHSYGQLDQCERMLDEIRLQEVRQAPDDSSKSSSVSATADTAVTTTASEAELDLESLMRSSAIVSSEIELDQLIGKLLHTLRESAGAQKAVLLQRSEDALLVRASQSEMGGIEDRLRPADPDRDVPLSIVQFTERNKSPTVLDNAASEGSFQADPY